MVSGSESKSPSMTKSFDSHVRDFVEHAACKSETRAVVSKHPTARCNQGKCTDSSEELFPSYVLFL